MQGMHYCMDGSGRAVDFRRNKVNDERTIINNFKSYCNKDNVTRAFCQIDRDSDEQVKEGMTTYGVETKDSQLMTIAIHENNYALCKDQMSVLNLAVQKANDKISERRKKIGKKIAIAGATVVLIGGAILATKVILDNKGSVKQDTGINITTEMTTEELSIQSTVDTLPVQSFEEDTLNMSAEDIRKSMEQSNQEETNRELEELRQNREELGLSTEPVITNSDEVVTQPVEETYNDEINLSADEIRAIVDKSQQEEMIKQKNELDELRKSYEEEYKVKQY